MAFNELEKKRCEKALSAFMEKHRPPPHIRSQLDLGYRVKGQSVEIFEIRPDWRDPTRKIEAAVAKATYVRTQATWKVFWQRADLKWHRYDPDAEVDSIEAFLRIVGADDHCCFFG